MQMTCCENVPSNACDSKTNKEMAVKLRNFPLHMTKCGGGGEKSHVREHRQIAASVAFWDRQFDLPSGV